MLRGITQINNHLYADFTRQFFKAAGEREYDNIFDLSSPSPKWVWDESGTLVETPAGQPAYSYNPETGDAEGQRLEGGATNNPTELPGEFTLSGASTRGTVQQFYGVDFDECIPDADSGTAGDTYPPGFTFNQTPEVEGVHTGAFIFVPNGINKIICRRNSGNIARPPVRFEFDASTGELSNVGDSNAEVTELPGGGWLLTFNFTYDVVANVGFNVGATDSDETDGTNSFYIGRVQVEEGPVATSWIEPNGSSAQIRSEDLLSLPDIDQADWYKDSDEGAFLIEFSGWEADRSSSQFILNDGNPCRWLWSQNNGVLCTSDGSSTLSSGVDSRGGGTYRAVTTWNATTKKILATGGTVQSAGHSGVLSTATKAEVFSLRNIKVNLSILKASRRMLSDSEMEDFVNGGAS